jgi:hypothetical protein
MSNCCSTSACQSQHGNQDKQAPRKHICPVNGKPYSAVPSTTISHHLKQPWNWQAGEQSYYFCDDPDCNVIYFAEDNSIIEQSALRTSVGIKERQADSLLCYCYGVSFQDSENNPDAKAFVIEKTKAGECACDTRNPSGRCCLKDFPK